MTSELIEMAQTKLHGMMDFCPEYSGNWVSDIWILPKEYQRGAFEGGGVKVHNRNRQIYTRR